jgi:hypothetical protein
VLWLGGAACRWSGVTPVRSAVGKSSASALASKGLNLLDLKWKGEYLCSVSGKERGDRFGEWFRNIESYHAYL